MNESSKRLLAVYDGHQRASGNFLWRVMGREGLASGETPLVTQFEKGFESVQNHTSEVLRGRVTRSTTARGNPAARPRAGASRNFLRTTAALHPITGSDSQHQGSPKKQM